MEPLFRIKKLVPEPEGFRAYWIESSAPVNVDDKAGASAMPGNTRVSLEEMTDPDAAIQEIAGYLNGSENPQIVISVHGFNSPLQAVLDRYKAAYEYLSKDTEIAQKPGLVCIGYRWPSEHLGGDQRSLFKAAPRGLLWLTGIALALLGAGGLLATPPTRGWLGRSFGHSLLYALGSLLAAVPFTAYLIRTIAYHRDGYRAVNYGVPDLLEVIRHLDKALNAAQPDEDRPTTERVKLSFIGHSMGALVVTNLIRILTDVFATSSMTESLKDSAASSAVSAAKARAAKGADEKLHQIGHTFSLERLVLVSPDVPAEALLQGRANFLQSSLHRFKEAYLFSNEGDEALRLISTMGNYFSFPTLNRDFGYRLGNVNVVKPPSPPPPQYGIVNLVNLKSALMGEAQRFLTILRAGRLTLADLAAQVATATPPAGASLTPPAGPASPLPALFTYFDCTDYVDVLRDPKSEQSVLKPIMTFAKCRPTLSDGNHFLLLVVYLFSRRWDKPDVHSGYFSAPFTQCLIYRLSCLGLTETLRSEPPLSLDPNLPPQSLSPGLEGWSAACAKRQIQVLLSPTHWEAWRNQP